MLHRERVKLPRYVYPPEEWRLVERQFYPRLLESSESVFSVGNGYLGLRGNFFCCWSLFEWSRFCIRI